MLLASKFEEMYAPEIGDFVYITDEAYDKPTIRNTESKMLAVLDYQLGDPLCLHFLRRNSKAAVVSCLVLYLNYLISSKLCTMLIVSFTPSCLVSS